MGSSAFDQSNRGKRKFQRDRKPAQLANWDHADTKVLAEFIVALTRNGRACRFGYTRDCGSYAIGIYGDGDPFTEYLPASSDIDEFLREITDEYNKLDG